jgi:hypothetical protein
MEFPDAFKAEASAGGCVSLVAGREGLGLDVCIAIGGSLPESASANSVLAVMRSWSTRRERAGSR